MLTDAKLAHLDELKEGAAAKPRHFNEGSDPHTEAVPCVRVRHRRKCGRAGRAIGAAEFDPNRLRGCWRHFVESKILWNVEAIGSA